jgi:hypothetical protein
MKTRFAAMAGVGRKNSQNRIDPAAADEKRDIQTCYLRETALGNGADDSFYCRLYDYR